jgi:hypothetical protein
MNSGSHGHNGRTTPAEPTPDYSHQAVLDGEHGLLPGARVYDREADDPSVAVVLRYADQTVSEMFTDGRSIASLNPAYPEDDKAVVVAFRSALDAAHPGWRAIDRAVLYDHINGSVEWYTYPESRLTTERDP